MNHNILIFGFTGTYAEPTTGARPLGRGYRWYLPSLMRFSAQDVLSPFGSGGISSYGYCAGDPINYIDPSGHAADPAELLGITKLATRDIGRIESGSSIAATTAAQPGYREGMQIRRAGSEPAISSSLGNSAAFQEASRRTIEPNLSTGSRAGLHDVPVPAMEKIVAVLNEKDIINLSLVSHSMRRAVDDALPTAAALRERLIGGGDTQERVIRNTIGNIFNAMDGKLQGVVRKHLFYEHEFDIKDMYDFARNLDWSERGNWELQIGGHQIEFLARAQYNAPDSSFYQYDIWLHQWSYYAE